MFPLICKANRENRTVDIVKRRGVITANRVHLKKYPMDNPVTIFNASIMVEEDELIVYGRIVMGYFTYASAIAEFRVPIKDIFNNLFTCHYTAEIVLYPDNRFDLWGVEDPRAYEIDGKWLITYCGRTVYYFDPSVRVERTLPITAILDRDGWRKLCVFRMPESLRNFVISDKNAFLIKTKKGYKLLHRLHMRDDRFYLTISDVPEDILNLKEFGDVIVENTALVMEHAKFEDKIGWGTPPVKVDGEYLIFLHGVDSETKAYRVFAILMNDEGMVTAVTPHYIMEPKECYEVYGDRPFTVFPCGAQLLDDSIILSYGAADSAVGIGEIDLSEIMSILDSNRIECYEE